MKLFILVIFMAVNCLGDTYLSTFVTDEPSVTATDAVASKRRIVYGETKVVSISCQTNVTVTLVAKAGSGGSLPADRIILGATAVTAPGLTTNLASTIWLAADRVELSTKSSSSATQTVKVNLVTEK